MNAVEYAKQNGIEKARIHLEKMKAERWINSFFNDLKQIVDAFELVESYGGLSEAKWDLDDPKIDASEALDLKQAINLVEQCQ